MSAQLDSHGRVATTVSQVQVLFDGTPAPLIYVSEGQISAMVPYGLAGKPSTQVQVVYQGVSSEPFQRSVAATQSAHDQPSTAFRNNPPNRIADR